RTALRHGVRGGGGRAQAPRGARRVTPRSIAGRAPRLGPHGASCTSTALVANCHPPASSTAVAKLSVRPASAGTGGMCSAAVAQLCASSWPMKPGNAGDGRLTSTPPVRSSKLIGTCTPPSIDPGDVPDMPAITRYVSDAYSGGASIAKSTTPPVAIDSVVGAASSQSLSARRPIQVCHELPVAVSCVYHSTESSAGSAATAL